MEIPGDRLSAQAGEPLKVDAWPIYDFKAEILRNLHFQFGGLMLSSIFRKIDWKFYFENLAHKLFVEWKSKTKRVFLRIWPLKWYNGHDFTLSGSSVWSDKRSPGISIVWHGGSKRRFAPKLKLKNPLNFFKWFTLFLTQSAFQHRAPCSVIYINYTQSPTKVLFTQLTQWVEFNNLSLRSEEKRTRGPCTAPWATTTSSVPLL